MKQTPLAIAMCCVGILGLTLGAQSASEPPARDFSASTNPDVVVVTIQIKDIFAPGLEQFELFGDGWLQRRTTRSGGQRAASSPGIMINRKELREALADLVDYEVVGADLSAIHQELEPSYGVLPDGRRFHAGVSEPGTGCVVTVNFKSVEVRGVRVASPTVSFALEPFSSYRTKRPDIRALEGIARFGEKLKGWLMRLRSAEEGT
ncbi:MAG: hypothetical protein ABI639_02925 [Thermoanaerobaculia bacterium]